MVIAIMACIGTLAAGLTVLTSNMLHNTSRSVYQTKAFNVAEAGLQSGQAVLQANWPSGTTPSPMPTVTPSAFRTQFPASDFPDPKSTSVPFVDVRFYDDVDYPNSTAIDRTVSTDANDNGYLWIVSQGATGSRSAKVMALVKKVDYTLQIKAGVAMATAGALSVSGTGNQDVVGIDPPATTAAVYDGTYSSNGQAKISDGLTKYDGTTPDAITNPDTGIFPAPVLLNLITTAHNAGKEFDSWGAMVSEASARGISLEDLWSSGPRVIVIDHGDVNAKDFPETDGGSTVWTEDEPGILIVLDGNCDDTGQKTTIYGVVYLSNGMLMRGNSEIHGMLVALGSATLKGTRAVSYNVNVINNLNSPSPLSAQVVPGTWRELSTQQP
jgi:hypothetical protein